MLACFLFFFLGAVGDNRSLVYVGRRGRRHAGFQTFQTAWSCCGGVGASWVSRVV